MNVVKEMKLMGYPIRATTPTVKCTLFKDNSGALILAQSPAMQPHTKHINIKYHHFRSHMARGDIQMMACRSEDQMANTLTKPNPVGTLKIHRKASMGW